MPDDLEKIVRHHGIAGHISVGGGIPFKEDVDFWEASLFAAAGMFSIIWRLAMTPPDPGGIFIHIMMCCFGLLFFALLSAWPLKRSFRLIVSFTALPVGTAVIFGYSYFDKSIFFPMLLTCAAIAGFIGLWTAERKIGAVFLLFILPLLISSWPDTFKHIDLILTVKGSDAQNVKWIEFVPSSKELQTVTVTAPEDISRLIFALRETYPYSPDHEKLESPFYTAGIVLASGGKIVFRLGRGNRVDSSSAWLEFGRRGMLIYQNPRLYRTIEALGIPLRLKAKDPSLGEDKDFYLVIGFIGLVFFGLGTALIVKHVQWVTARVRSRSEKDEKD